MATINSIVESRSKRQSREGARRTPIVAIEISFELTGQEASVLPSSKQLYKVLGPAMSYQSMILGGKGELVVRYKMADRPFGTADSSKVPQLALRHIESCFIQLFQKQPKSTD